MASVIWIASDVLTSLINSFTKVLTLTRNPDILLLIKGGKSACIQF